MALPSVCVQILQLQECCCFWEMNVSALVAYDIWTSQESLRHIEHIRPRLDDTTGCQTGLITGWMFAYTMQPVVQLVWQQAEQPQLYRLYIHSTDCQSGCTTGWQQVECATGWMHVYTMHPVVQPVVQPVSQHVVLCRWGSRENEI